MNEGCRDKLAPEQWWGFCGETDMGQTLPVLCTACGGDMIRADDPNAEQRVQEMLIIWKKQTEDAQEQNRRSEWKRPNRWNKVDVKTSTIDEPLDETPKSALGVAPSFIWIKPSPTPTDRTEKLIRESINPFDLGLGEAETLVLSAMIRKAAEDIVRVSGGVTDKQAWEEMDRTIWRAGK